MTYRRSILGETATVEDMMRELERVERAFDVSDLIQMKQWHTEPPKRKEGMLLLADGTDWDPGSGQGVYAYYAGAWHKLG